MHTNWRHFVAKWCGDIAIPTLFDYSGLRFPGPGKATRAQLIAPLPAPDATPPTWEGQERVMPHAASAPSAPRAVTAPVTPRAPLTSAPLTSAPQVPTARATYAAHAGHMAP